MPVVRQVHITRGHGATAAPTAPATLRVGHDDFRSPSRRGVTREGMAFDAAHGEMSFGFSEGAAA